jgi:transcriptional regulator with PAS, ATPase and Fis domain
LGGTEESKVDVRLIAATNRDLDKLVEGGTFRHDLFYRLNVVSLTLPPLRDRREDIALLVHYFLGLKAQESSAPLKKLAPEVIDFLVSYDWPGNVRELENLIERLTILTPSETITLEDLPGTMHSHTTAQKASLQAGDLNEARSLSDAVDGFERELILKALQKTGFNQTRAASLLGTSRRILRYRIEKLKIDVEEMSGKNTKLSE